MHQLEIKDLCTRPEDQWFDRKSSRIAGKDLAKVLVAMANAEGGKVAVGITDDGQVEGRLSAEKENALRIAAHEFTDPAVRVKIRRIDDILIFDVAQGNRVHFTTSGECYLRLGDKSVKLNAHQQQELRYSKGEQLFDAEQLPNTSLEDLDLNAAKQLADRIGSSSAIDALRARRLIDADEGVTVAGMLLFGKDPQRHFPAAEVRVVKFFDDNRAAGAQQQLVEDRRFAGTLPEQILNAAACIRSLLPPVTRLGHDGLFATSTQIPGDAWLEGLVNAVIHRSYSMMGDNVRVEIYPSRIEISSPGRFPGMADPSNPEMIPRFARNPHIARVMTDLGIGQELGEGIRRIFAEIRRVGFLDPEYVQTNGSVILSLRAKQRLVDSQRFGLPGEAEKILVLLEDFPAGMGTGEIADSLKVSRPQARKLLGELREANLVEWQGNSAKDPRARWLLRPPLV